MSANWHFCKVLVAVNASSYDVVSKSSSWLIFFAIVLALKLIKIFQFLILDEIWEIF